MKESSIVPVIQLQFDPFALVVAAAALVVAWRAHVVARRAPADAERRLILNELRDQFLDVQTASREAISSLDGGASAGRPPELISSIYDYARRHQGRFRSPDGYELTNFAVAATLVRTQWSQVHSFELDEAQAERLADEAQDGGDASGASRWHAESIAAGRRRLRAEQGLRSDLTESVENATAAVVWIDRRLSGVKTRLA